ncbi:hypothetical protein L1987_06181 [Smallanthus sonchifolius]|uniref:Uncharacterized protein n=1 Tax=Smallanthus sonchifolius TaxID=185202 RepID=A0ACB9JXF0_9ASTR|nr:hypothetical protein L1987_06181 [Smallanthus sonchifolius]
MTEEVSDVSLCRYRLRKKEARVLIDRLKDKTLTSMNSSFESSENASRGYHRYLGTRKSTSLPGNSSLIEGAIVGVCLNIDQKRKSNLFFCSLVNWQVAIVFVSCF